MTGKKSFVLFNDLKEPVNSLTDEEAGKLFKAIFEYQNGGVNQVLTAPAEMAFLFVKQQLDRNQEKYDSTCKRNRLNGLKGGRPNKPKKPSGLSGNPEEPKKADNDIDTDNGIENDIEDKKINYSITDTIIDYFNKTTGQKRRHSKASRTPIHARLIDVYSIEDCKKVIDIKYNEWKDNEDMGKYITIETFFRPGNFEKYLNQQNGDTEDLEKRKRIDAYMTKAFKDNL